MTSLRAASLLLAVGWALGYEQEKGTVTMHSYAREERGLLEPALRPPPPPAARPRGRDQRATPSHVRHVRGFPVYPQWHGYPGLHGHGYHGHGYHGHGYHGWPGYPGLHHGHYRPGYGTIHAHGHIGPHGIHFHGHIKHKPKKKPFKHHKYKHKRRHRYDSWLY